MKIAYKGGADVPLFETIKTNAGTQSKKWVTAVSFGMAVAFKMFIKELRRNGGETAATAENRHLPQNFFAISRRIRQFWIIWDQLIFLEKK